MKRHKDHFKNKKDAIYEDVKYCFHKKEDKSDFESFAITDQVTGIDETPPAQTFTPI